MSFCLRLVVVGLEGGAEAVAQARAALHGDDALELEADVSLLAARVVEQAVLVERVGVDGHVAQHEVHGLELLLGRVSDVHHAAQKVHACRPRVSLELGAGEELEDVEGGQALDQGQDVDLARDVPAGVHAGLAQARAHGVQGRVGRGDLALEPGQRGLPGAEGEQGEPGAGVAEDVARLGLDEVPVHKVLAEEARPQLAARDVAHAEAEHLGGEEPEVVGGHRVALAEAHEGGHEGADVHRLAPAGFGGFYTRADRFLSRGTTLQ
jgi:hypothetical protein